MKREGDKAVLRVHRSPSGGGGAVIDIDKQHTSTPA